MIYRYECQVCNLEHEYECKVSDRQTVPCPRCEALPKDQLIIVQPSNFKMGHQDRMITDAECEHKYGKDWRETDGSRRMATDTAKRKYIGTGGKR